MKAASSACASILVLALFFIGCGEETTTGPGGSNGTPDPPAPVAAFSMDKATAETGETVTFTNTSQNATSYAWDFGDGGTSTEASPTHSYSTDGTFTIGLTATGAGGSNSTSRSITVTAPPIPWIGSWTLTEATRGGNAIVGLSATLTILEDSTYGSSFDDGTNSGSTSYAKLTVSDDEMTSNLGNIVLNGLSSSYTIVDGVIVYIWRASMSTSLTAWNNYGDTASLHTDGTSDPITYSVQGDTLTLEHGTTVLTYSRD